VLRCPPSLPRQDSFPPHCPSLNFFPAGGDPSLVPRDRAFPPGMKFFFPFCRRGTQSSSTLIGQSNFLMRHRIDYEAYDREFQVYHLRCWLRLLIRRVLLFTKSHFPDDLHPRHDDRRIPTQIHLKLEPNFLAGILLVLSRGSQIPRLFASLRRG